LGGTILIAIADGSNFRYGPIIIHQLLICHSTIHALHIVIAQRPDSTLPEDHGPISLHLYTRCLRRTAIGLFTVHHRDRCCCCNSISTIGMMVRSGHDSIKYFLSFILAMWCFLLRLLVFFLWVGFGLGLGLLDVDVFGGGC